MKKIFVASSDQASQEARYVAALLRELGAVVTFWKDYPGFVAGELTLGALEKASHEHSGGIFFFAQDDELAKEKDGHCKFVPRDNVILELGLFCGNLGRRFVAVCAVKDVHVLTDWSGIGHIEFNPDHEDKLKKDLENWLSGVPDFYNLPQKNVYIGSRKSVHDRCSLDDRLHISDGGYKQIRSINLMNFASNLFVNPEVADFGHFGRGFSMAEAMNKIMTETEATMALVLTKPTEYNLLDVETKIPNHRAGGAAGSIRSAVIAVYNMLTSNTVYRDLNGRRFEFYLSRISIPFGIFSVIFCGEYERFNHIKIDLYSAELNNEDDRRSFIIWQYDDPTNYQFFLDTFNRMKQNGKICEVQTVDSLKVLVDSLKQ